LLNCTLVIIVELYIDDNCGLRDNRWIVYR